MLAEAFTQSPVGLAAWLACGAFVVGLANGLLKLADRIKDKPSAGEVRGEAADKFVPKVEFQAHVALNQREHENLFKKIGGVERGHNERMDQHLRDMQKSAEEGREKLHERINDVLKAVSRLEGKMEERQ